MESQLPVSKNVNSKLHKQVVALERQCWANSQYSRRECLETTGVPDSISNDDLEEPTIKIFDKLDVAIHRSNIEDCHWLKINGPKCANAIRKDKKKSKGMNLCSIGINNPVFINDRFCSYYTI